MTLLLKNLLFTLLVPGTIAIFIPLSMTEGVGINLHGGYLAGFVLELIGFAIYLWCIWDFSIVGQGTPAPVDAPKHLVIRGLYQYSRNPMYVGVLCVILGWAILYSSLSVLIYAISVACCFQLFIVFYEEPVLQQLFGSDYVQYRGAVNRWLPKFYRN